MVSSLKAAGRLAVAAAAVLIGLPARGEVTLETPDWEITLTDFGYSDLLLDKTPGFQGREYLSGEWGAAVAYRVGELDPVSPKWLEPQFIYPDWTTNSDFLVVTPIHRVAVNDVGLAIAESVIRNADLEIAMRFEIVDTVLGTPMGNAADSAGGGGGSLRSNRYVLSQTYTVRNISGAAISGLQFFQLVHSLNGQRGCFDPRVYPGPFASSHYDVTLSGMDPYSVGYPSAPEGLEDFVGFHSPVAPSAFEIGHYGISGNGLDNHVFGKPSDGVHLSIEDNWLTSPFAERMGRDSFEPESRWVAGGQRWNLMDLAPGESTSLPVMLSLRTATRVGWQGSTASCGGGSDHQDGVDFEFPEVTQPGLCFARTRRADAREIGIMVANGSIPTPDFPRLGALTQFWELEFTGQHAGGIQLTFAYDPALVPQSFDPAGLCIYQSDGAGWQQLPTTVNPVLKKVSFTASGLSVFALGAPAGSGHEVFAGAFPGAAGGVVGAGTYTEGASVTVSATAAEGFVFDHWSENGQVVGVSPGHSFVIHEDHALEAHFIAAGDLLAVSTNSLPSLGGLTSGDGAYETGALVTVEAVPNPGYRFDRWLLDGVEVGDSAQYAFTAESSASVTAAFSRVYTVTAAVQPEEAGDVLNGGVYEPDRLAELRILANPGYVFTSWTENGVLVGVDSTLRFLVSGDRAVVANFAPLVEISVESSASQSGTCWGGGGFAQGVPVGVHALASPGYVFAGWTVDGEVVSETPDFVFQADASQHLIAVFEAMPSLSLAAPADGTLTLAWPGTAAAWILQESHDLATGWVDSTRTVEVVGGMNRVVITGFSDKGFFRLRRP